MKKFIGRAMSFRVDGKTVTCKVIGETQDRIIACGSDKTPTYIIKSHVSMFRTVESDEDKARKELFVLACENRRMKCPGVRFVKVGKVRKSDFDVLVEGCPSSSKDCKFDCLGDIFELSGRELEGLLGGTIFGDYPEAPSEDNSTGEEESDDE